jgi:hypothetical protein
LTGGFRIKQGAYIYYETFQLNRQL